MARGTAAKLRYLGFVFGLIFGGLAPGSLLSYKPSCAIITTKGIVAMQRMVETATSLLA